jgi:chromosome segregation ATPase
MNRTRRALTLFALLCSACGTADLRRDNEALQARLAEADARADGLRGERDGLATAAKERQAELDALRGQLDAARREGRALEARLARAEVLRDELRRAKTALEAARREIAELEREIDGLNRDLARLAKPAAPDKRTD